MKLGHYFITTLLVFSSFILFSQESYEIKLVRKNQLYGVLVKMKLDVNQHYVKIRRKGNYEIQTSGSLILKSNHFLNKKEFYQKTITKDTTIVLKYGFSLYCMKPKVYKALK